MHAAADVLELSIESSFVFAVAPTVRIVAHSCSVCPLFCDEHPMCILPYLLKKLFEDPQLTIIFHACDRLPTFLVSLWDLCWNLQQENTVTHCCVFMSPVKPDVPLCTIFTHSCPSTIKCPWHADFVVYTNVRPSELAATSKIEH